MNSPGGPLFVLLLVCYTVLSPTGASKGKGTNQNSDAVRAKLTSGMVFGVIGIGIIFTGIVYCCKRWIARRRNPKDPGYFTARKEEEEEDAVAITFEPATDCEFSEDGSVFSSMYSSPLTTSDSSSLPQTNMWLSYVSKVREARTTQALQPSPKEGHESVTPTSDDSRLPRYSEIFGSDDKSPTTSHLRAII